MTKAGIEFRDLVNSWVGYKLQLEHEDRKNRATSLVNGSNFIVFFKNKGELYGTSEDQRLTLSMIKSPTEADMPGIQSVNFSAVNLHDAMRGDVQPHLFFYKDRNDIHIIHDKKELIEQLAKGKG